MALGVSPALVNSYVFDQGENVTVNGKEGRIFYGDGNNFDVETTANKDGVPIVFDGEETERLVNARDIKSEKKELYKGRIAGVIKNNPVKS